MENSNVSRYGALTPNNCAIVLIDHNLGFTQCVSSADRTTIKSGVVSLAKTAKLFNIPLIVTNGISTGVGGNLIPQLVAVLGDTKVIERPNGDMDSFNDPEVSKAVKATGRKKLVIAGIMTDVCVLMATLHALKDGYEVYVVPNASGGSDAESTERALTRMTQAGATVSSWVTILAELQLDWSPARSGTVPGLMEILSDHCNGWSNLMDYYYAPSA